MLIGFEGKIAYSAAARLLKENPGKVRERLADFYIKEFEALNDAKEHVHERELRGAYAVKIGEGGIFRSLWELGRELSCGIYAELDKIYVHQHVIEILEIFGEDPYSAESEGAYVYAFNEEDAEISRYLGIFGRTTNDNKRIVNTGAGIRFLVPPKRQAKDMLDAKRNKN